MEFWTSINLLRILPATKMLCQIDDNISPLRLYLSEHFSSLAPTSCFMMTLSQVLSEIPSSSYCMVAEKETDERQHPYLREEDSCIWSFWAIFHLVQITYEIQCTHWYFLLSKCNGTKEVVFWVSVAIKGWTEYDSYVIPPSRQNKKCVSKQQSCITI